MMCCFLAVQFLWFDAWFPLQFMHLFVVLVHLFWEQSTEVHLSDILTYKISKIFALLVA